MVQQQQEQSSLLQKECENLKVMQQEKVQEQLLLEQQQQKQQQEVAVKWQLKVDKIAEDAREQIEKVRVEAKIAEECAKTAGDVMAREAEERHKKKEAMLQALHLEKTKELEVSSLSYIHGSS